MLYEVITLNSFLLVEKRFYAIAKNLMVVGNQYINLSHGCKVLKRYFDAGYRTFIGNRVEDELPGEHAHPGIYID